MSRRLVRPISLLAVTALLVVAVLALVVESRRRGNLYWYDVDADYRYAFGSVGVARVDVELDSDRLVIPALPASAGDGWDTALLSVDVTTTLSGSLFEPSVEVTTPEAAPVRQFYELGAAGRRHVVLPDPAGWLAEGAVVELEPNHLRFRERAAELILFDSATSQVSRILVLAPHPDDAELAAFGLYASHESWVVTLTAGNYVDGQYASIYADRERQDRLKGELRTWDSLVVPLLGGVDPGRVANLGYRTLTLEDHFNARTDAEDGSSAGELSPRYRRGNVEGLLPGRAPAESFDSVVADLARVVETVAPQAIIAPHPSLDANTDHQFTTVALLEALERLGDDETELLLYTNHHVESEHWPFGPADSLVTLPPLTKREMLVPRVLSFPLDHRIQVMKLFALDAMHDLRDPPERQLGGVYRRMARRLARGVGDVLRDPFESYSYFRRAARPNELFFVYGPADRAELERTFLDGRPATER